MDKLQLIYVSSEHGDDNNDGLTSETPLRSTDLALERSNCIHFISSKPNREAEHFFYHPIKDDMADILAANPGMSREDAFFQTVIERAEELIRE